MPKICRLDLDMVRRTQDLPGGPVHILIEEEIPDIGMMTDSSGNPTRGGLIGYAIAYLLMAGFVGYFLFVM